MPISDRSGAGRRKAIPALFAALTFLAACDETGMLTGAGPGTALEAAAMDDGAIVIKGPAGYCVDGKSLRNRGTRQFALVAQCDLLSTGEVVGVTSLAFLTVTAVRSSDDTPLPSAEQIAASFGPAQILYDARIDNIQVVQLSQGGKDATKQADPVHWRGVMNVKGHTIGLAAYSMQDGSGAGLEGRNLLLSLGRNIRNASQ